MESRVVKDAIMGVLGVDPEEEADIMDRKTTYFSSDIRTQIKELGLVKSIGEKYGDIVKNIDDGIAIADLIKKVSELT
jgi:hypothetical protein